MNIMGRVTVTVRLLNSLGIVGILVVAASCGSATVVEQETFEPLGVDDCIVWLHGKTEKGAPSVVEKGIGQVSPSGNQNAGDGREWIYFPDPSYLEARSIVFEAIEGSECQNVVVSGFSNGGAFAAKLYCQGETFGNRLVGVVVDDPPPDFGTAECEPDSDVDVALYWTGSLDDAATPGADCRPIRWTCEGDSLAGITAYAAALGTVILPSPFDDHVWFRDAPEIERWLKLDEKG